jgi:hypothetical protein
LHGGAACGDGEWDEVERRGGGDDDKSRELDAPHPWVLDADAKG